MCQSNGMPGENGTTDSVETVIVAALAEEADAVVNALGNCEVRRRHGVDLHIGSVNGRGVLVLPVNAMGNASSAQATQRAMAIWNPAQVMVVGIAGGARGAGDDLRLGDVLVPDQVVGYESAKVKPGGQQVRYETYRPSSELLEIARSVPPAEWALKASVPRPDGESGRTLPQAHFGPVFSGEKVVADADTMRRLRDNWPKALGVEMEGLGVAIAGYRHGPGFLLVKAVCDFADEDKEDSWHAYAADVAARFAVAVLQRRHEPPAAGRPQAVPLTGAAPFSGKTKVQFCRRLDNWEEIADDLQIPAYVSARFERGNEPRRLWEYLERRDRLFSLPDALDATGRKDLADLLRADLP
jgi:nucleoside phosphorylase